MRRPLLRLLLVLLMLAAAAGAARAQDFSLPGLSGDAGRYAAGIATRNPAGATPAARRDAEARAAAAEARGDWDGATAAWETRAGMGNAGTDVWLALARDQMRRAKPDYAHALDAAWLAFRAASGAGTDEVPPLLAIADALQHLDRPVQLIQTLQAAQDRNPDDAALKTRLTAARRAAGLLVLHVTQPADADPPRACIAFTTPPQRGDDFHPQDWVRLDPPVAGAAVTREGDQICVSGLPAGATTRIILRAGLPGEGGLRLTKDAVVAAAIPNRPPSIAFDQRLFILPRGQAPAVSMATVNLSRVKLTLARMTERTIASFLRRTTLGQPTDVYAAQEIGTEYGATVWTGSAAIPHFAANRTVHTALPLPDALHAAGPGVYALIATPGDGTPDDAGYAQSVQMIVNTDLAPTVWRGDDGLVVQVRSYATAQALAGVRLQLLSQGNEVLGEATTDAQGVARFAAPLLHGQDAAAPRSINVFGPHDDYASIDLSAAAFDLSDRGVTGQPYPGPLDAWMYTDRGIYRPGETVQLMALLRDAAGRPADLPARVTVRRPNGQVFLQATPARGDDGAIHLPVVLSQGAGAGIWTVELRADPDAPPIGTTTFRVDAFVPDRLAVDVGPAPGPVVPGRPYRLPVAARYLYGAPAAGLSGKARVTLAWDPAPFPALDGFRIGLADETYAPDARDLDLPDTDAQGHTTLSLDLPAAPDSTHALKAEIVAAINDPSGHAARGKLTVKVRPGGNLIGVRPAFAGDAIDAGAEAGFDLAAVSPDGARVALKATLRLLREEPDWRLVRGNRLPHYQVVWRDVPLATETVSIPAAGVLHWARRLDFGRYRIDVAESGGGLAATSYRFRAGWVATDNPDVPDQLDVAADRATHRPGETARVHVAAPFDGQATLLVLTGRVHLIRNVTVSAKGTDLDVPVGTDWGPGAYVVVHAYRPAAAGGRAERAIGLTWIGIDPSARTIAARIDVPDKLPPRARAVVPVHTDPGAWVTLAAVDEGILRLTSFVSPDPAPHFLGRRRLGIDIRDDWGRLIAPATGEATVLQQGGDAGYALPDIPIRTVSLFAGPVRAGADGIARIPLDLPDFAGQVRLMAVTWQGARIGSASADVLVRDPLVAEPLLPRFLAPGDEARLTVLLHNLDLPAGAATVDVSTEGPLAVAGPAHLSADLAPGAQATPVALLRATGAGRAVVRLAVHGPGGFAVTRTVAITVRPSRAPVSVVTVAELPAGGQVALDPGAGRFVAGTWSATASYGGVVRYDVAGLVRALADYPLLCLEQATSKGMGLVFLPDGPLAGPDRAGQIQRAASRVLDLQRYDGGFGLWSATGDAEPWLSAYAAEFLWHARDAGATVPQPALDDALKYLAGTLDAGTPDTPEAFAAQAYALEVLAMAGRGRPGLARVLAQDPDRLPTPLARAQIAAALAFGHDRPRAEALMRDALAFKARRFWAYDDGTPVRDQAALVVLLRATGLLPSALHALAAELPGADLDPRMVSTQEQAWLIAAAAALGRDAAPAHVALDGTPLPAAPVVAVSLAGPARMSNLAAQPVWQSLSVSGVPTDPAPAARNLMHVARHFFTLDGGPLDLDHLKQNTVFVLELDGAAEDGQDHQAMLLAGLPAGWEIERRLPAGAVAGMPWLGTLTDTAAQPAADDRYAAVLDLTGAQPGFRVAVELRAVTPGSYELPGAALSDMYRPTLFARQATGRITVLPVE